LRAAEIPPITQKSDRMSTRFLLVLS